MEDMRLLGPAEKNTRVVCARARACVLSLKLRHILKCTHSKPTAQSVEIHRALIINNNNNLAIISAQLAAFSQQPDY